MQGDFEQAESNLPGLLCGRGRLSGTEQINADGRVYDTANPWIHMYHADLLHAVFHGLFEWDGLHLLSLFVSYAFMHYFFVHT